MGVFNKSIKQQIIAKNFAQGILFPSDRHTFDPPHHGGGGKGQSHLAREFIPYLYPSQCMLLLDLIF